MCGFAGVIHWDGEGVAAEDLNAMALLLRHRGPDESGVAVPQPGVGLSHSRLRVLDLSRAARQPMTNESQTVWLCFNGEIYNFRELREELQAKGFRFKSRSDTEAILHAYEAWGTEAFLRLDGMFAIALWDARARSLLLARDRTGKKPLFYWTDGRCLAWGSEIKALWAHPHVPRQIHEKALPHLLTYGYPPPGESCYEGIRQILPAAWMRFSAEERSPAAHRYWALPQEPPPASCPAAQAEASLRRLLGAAVARRLISDVPLGAFLSGGLDSTLIVGLMAAQMDRPVRTFSIGFEGDPSFNETSFAQIAARHFQTEHSVFVVKPQPFKLLEQLVWHFDQPFGDSSAVPTYLLCQLARSKVTVALNGDGGDELFAGYDRFRAALLSERIPRVVRTLGRRVLKGLPRRVHSRSVLGRLRRFCEAADQPVEARYMNWIGYFPAPPTLPRKSLNSSLRTLLQRLLWFNFEEYLPNDLHVKMDRCSMAHGLETRSPFLDTALVEWAFRLPDSFKLRGWTTKWILRHAFRELLPPAILQRGKMGFGVPLDVWFRRQWREPLQDLLEAPHARISRYLDPYPIRQTIHRHLSGLEEAGGRLWLLLTFELWLRQLERPLPIAPEGAVQPSTI